VHALCMPELYLPEDNELVESSLGPRLAERTLNSVGSRTGAVAP